jgi:nitroimidazol reductase NimA-like FMN-containing flavoprotein (pyridoxamine 5'-phosphate oxidase superfamily)
VTRFLISTSTCFCRKKTFANLATVMPDGSPQVTPVWFAYSGGFVRVNTAMGAGTTNA